jgi:hypothetical protein
MYSLETWDGGTAKKEVNVVQTGDVICTHFWEVLLESVVIVMV